MKVIILSIVSIIALLLCACQIPVINQQQQNCANQNIFNAPLDSTFDRNELCGTANDGVINSGNSGFFGL